MISSNVTDEIRRLFEATLNEHGYGFQYSLLTQICSIANKGQSSWLPEVAEFPVDLGNGTRLDFVLRRHHAISNGNSRYDKNLVLMVAECKRANPSFCNWCFARAPYTYQANSTENEYIQFEQVEKFDKTHIDNEHISATAFRPGLANNVYHIGLEVKMPHSVGDKTTGKAGTGAIEDAASQVCRGLNGLINSLGQRPKLFTESNKCFVIPAIFTTANLWVSEIDVSDANLGTGQIDFSQHELRQVAWLYYQYNLSPGLKHSLGAHNVDERDLREVLRAEYIRTIPIISPSGVSHFLEEASAYDLEFCH